MGCDTSDTQLILSFEVLRDFALTATIRCGAMVLPLGAAYGATFRGPTVGQMGRVWRSGIVFQPLLFVFKLLLTLRSAGIRYFSLDLLALLVWTSLHTLIDG